ncbi:AAA family ATPase [Nocardia gipuzkoensis]|uniref:AAA family ATPase n=1 Tax=Nocardia gipuzkoensis TaxID=2749991 RepID=UPI00237EA746|nr:AAA family ATPase [Nocardia gipuzkoensis]MDE1671752.1 AAA family ATPase [Nocardia gipuzkoensis]
MSQPRPEVVRPVTVAIAGTHSTGKTTFLTQLADRLRRDRVNVAVVSDLGAQAEQVGLPILYNHTWASTLWIVTRGISNEIQSWTSADVVLIDRAVPDALGYYEAALEHRNHRADPHRIHQLEHLIANHSHNYDLVLRTVLDNRLPLGLTKPRETDMEFRALADRHVEKVLTRLNIEHDLLPAHGHDRAVVKTLTFINERLGGPPSYR